MGDILKPSSEAELAEIVRSATEPFEIVGRDLLDASSKVEDVGKIDGVLPAYQVAGYEPSRAQDHRESLKVRLVHIAQNDLFESRDRCLGDRFLILPGLEIAP